MTDMNRVCPESGPLAAWLEGSLSAEERARITAHLSECDRCRRAAGLAATSGGAPVRPVDEVLLARIFRAAGTVTRSTRPSCVELDFLAAWVEGALSREERARVTAHLGDCDECRRAVELASGVESAPARPLDEVLLARIHQGSRQRSPGLAWVAAAAGLLVALIIPVLATRSRGPDPVAAAPKTPPAVKVARPELPGEVPYTPESHPEAVEVRKPVPLDPMPPATPPVKPPSVPMPAPVADSPKPVPVPEPPAPPPAVPSPPPTAAVDLASLFTPFVLSDPAGDLWVRRTAADSVRARIVERVGIADVVAAPAETGAFVVDGRSTLVLEKGAEALVGYVKPEQVYAVILRKGAVLVDTEGAAQNWRFTVGDGLVTFMNATGRLMAESRGDKVAVTLLEGRGDLRIGPQSRKAEAGRTVSLARDGQVTSEKAAPDRRRIDLLLKARPAEATAWSAAFDEQEGDRPFAYTLTAGRRVEDSPAEAYLGLAPDDFSRSTTGKFLVSSGVKPEAPLLSTSGMILKFRYRTTSASFVIRLGKYSLRFVSRNTGGAWSEARVPLSSFMHEGVTMGLMERVADVWFEGIFDRNSGQIDVDAIQFLRRLR